MCGMCVKWLQRKSRSGHKAIYGSQGRKSIASCWFWCSHCGWGETGRVATGPNHEYQFTESSRLPSQVAVAVKQQPRLCCLLNTPEAQPRSWNAQWKVSSVLNMSKQIVIRCKGEIDLIRVILFSSNSNLISYLFVYHWLAKNSMRLIISNSLLALSCAIKRRACIHAECLVDTIARNVKTKTESGWATLSAHLRGHVFYSQYIKLQKQIFVQALVHW